MKENSGTKSKSSYYESMDALQKKLISRVLNSVSDDMCWIWLGASDADGYGIMRLNGVSALAHRASYMAFNGEIPPMKCVMHTCDNPQCINPKHLIIGTRRDNALDMANKNRGFMKRGIDHPRKFSRSSDAQLILECIDRGIYQSLIAIAFGISRSNVGYIKRKFRHQ